MMISERFNSLKLRRLLSVFIFFLFIACSSDNKINQTPLAQEPSTITTDDYELVIPNKQDGLLILFPCYPCDAENTKSEFNIVDMAVANNISVLLMNFNKHLWLSKSEKKDLENIILNAISNNSLNVNNTFIGGFSGGGNVTLLLSDYLKSSSSLIQPKGIFIVDSPIDLLALYESAQLTMAKKFSEPAIQEAKWIIDSFELEFGVGDSAFNNYLKKSPYTSKAHFSKNLSHLNNVNIRLYSEPDTAWWMENRQASYENMNACYIEKLAKDLSKRYGDDWVDYIKTEDRGYRANGDRHPHSWAIVDEQNLIDWIVTE